MSLSARVVGAQCVTSIDFHSSPFFSQNLQNAPPFCVFLALNRAEIRALFGWPCFDPQRRLRNQARRVTYVPLLSCPFFFFPLYSFIFYFFIFFPFFLLFCFPFFPFFPFFIYFRLSTRIVAAAPLPTSPMHSPGSRPSYTTGSGYVPITAMGLSDSSRSAGRYASECCSRSREYS